MAQPSPAIEANGASASPQPVENGDLLSGKRKREENDEKDDVMEDVKPEATWAPGDQKALIRSYFQILTSIDVEPSILKHPIPESSSEEPRAKRQKSAEPASTISDKVAAEAYEHMEDLANDLLLAIQSALSEIEATEKDQDANAAKISKFKDQAMLMFRREKAYPGTALTPETDADGRGQTVLSVVGLAPQEKRLFSSLPASKASKWDIKRLPAGVNVLLVKSSNSQERTPTLGELFAPPRSLPPLQPPKQPKTQAKGNALDFYHPDLTDLSRTRGNTYFSAKLSSGHFLDYSQAVPSSQTVTKRHERAQSLTGKKPLPSEVQMAESDALFRGAFSSFAPSKDDSAALVPSSTAGRMWWQRKGQRSFQTWVDVEFYGGAEDGDAMEITTDDVHVDELAVQDAIDNWDESAVDPSLNDIMGAKRDDEEKDADEILDEVSDMIETLASYQRIRNLTLPNSQNRQTSDPVQGDMLATAGPQPSDEETAAYEVLKAQLALIIKTLPPYAVAKLNGDQLEELLVSTKVQVQTDQYGGVMDEDEAGVQARLRAQQVAQAGVRPPGQPTPSMPNAAAPFGGYTPGQTYQTPSRTPAHPQQYRPNPIPNYSQPRHVSQPVQHRPQPNQYSRPNGYANHASQFASHLAKAQTPYGHQNVPQYGSQRPGWAQGGNPNMRHNQMQFQGQQPATPTPGPYGSFSNGNVPPRTMSPQVQAPVQGSHSPSPTISQTRFNNQHPGMGRFSSSASPGPPQNAVQNPSLTGYHTVIPEAQQQRILDQAKARVAAQERSASFGAGIGGRPVSRPGNGTPTMMQQQTPHKVTPVPVPVFPGSQPPPR